MITPNVLNERIQTLLGLYGDRRASAATLLCDQHDPDGVAYTIVGENLATHDLTFRALREESERFASGLGGLGIGPGDRVATLMGKSREYLVGLLGIWRLGAVHVPLFTAFAPPAIAFRLISAETKAVICDANQVHKLAASGDMPDNPMWRVIVTGAGRNDGAIGFSELMEGQQAGFSANTLGGDAPLIQIYTSGTTGRPKGVVFPVRALACCHAYGEFGLGLTRNDVYWCAADPGWAYGLYFGVLSSLTIGVKGVLLEGGFSAERTFAVLDRLRVTNFAAAPTVYRSLRASGTPVRRLPHLRCASSAGEPLTAEVNEWASQALGRSRSLWTDRSGNADQQSSSSPIATAAAASGIDGACNARLEGGHPARDGRSLRRTR